MNPKPEALHPLEKYSTPSVFQQPHEMPKAAGIAHFLRTAFSRETGSSKARDKLDEAEGDRFCNELGRWGLMRRVFRLSIGVMYL